MVFLSRELQRGDSQNIVFVMVEDGAERESLLTMAAELVRAVCKLQKEPDVAEEMGTSGRQYVAEHYNRNVLAKSFEEMMIDLLDSILWSVNGTSMCHFSG